MDRTIEDQIKCLGLDLLAKEWDTVLKNAQKHSHSYHRFLSDIIEKEYRYKKEKARLARIKRAKIPELFVLETFPFVRQPRLKKKLVFELYDSQRFITEKQDLVFIGPTGCGKTGLATSFLVHAINLECRGMYIDFKELMNQLYQSQADHSEHKILNKYQSYDILLIDEIGYSILSREQAGLFFDLMKRRNKKRTTIVTTQLGFNEWNNFLQDEHITAALLDRITQNCTVFNMKECISLRSKKIVMAAASQQTKLDK